jgi:hypothetical protein
MGIQYFVPLSAGKLAYHFLTTDGSTNSTTLILQGCGEQPDQDFLTLIQ